MLTRRVGDRLSRHLADRELNVWEFQWRERCAARETLDTFEAGRGSRWISTASPSSSLRIPAR